ncbi:MAG TPA: hypothetical protein VHX86_10030 [Tepidisphaeraceae bacterium]|jgi:hypothetical protein|nr:hypothetical protein [Tepidisphaeraceae bacterium]
MLQDSELARRIDGKIEIRTGGLRLRWDLSELVTADGHTAQGVFTGTVRALPDPNEIKMLEEALLGGGPAATGMDVVAHFATSILTASRKYARQCDAQNLVGDEGRRGMLGVLLEAARAVAFGCGVEVVQPAQVDLDCPTLKKQQIEAMQREAAQRRVADQVDHLRQSAELFGQFESIRASAPELSPGQVLSRIGAADQADVFRAIVAASAKNAERVKLWAVAGPYLISIEREESPRAEMIAAPDDLGPLRSVRGDGSGGLLLGCRSGVLRMNPDSPKDAGKYHDPDVNSQLGFNSAISTDDRIWAAHGEAGLVCWKLDQPDKPCYALRPTSAGIAGFSPRNLQRLAANRLIFSSGRQLYVVAGEATPTPIGQPADSDVVAIFLRPGQILTAHSDGQVCSWSGDNLQLDCRQRRAGRVEAAAVLPWLGDARLLLATEDGPIVCVGPDDELVTQYTSLHRGLRMVGGAADAVAAITPDRQRLVLWHAWDGRKPFAEMHIYGLARHRIADISFVGEDTASEAAAPRGNR